jgi:hypothetical protein
MPAGTLDAFDRELRIDRGPGDSCRARAPLAIIARPTTQPIDRIEDLHLDLCGLRERERDVHLVASRVRVSAVGAELGRGLVASGAPGWRRQPVRLSAGKMSSLPNTASLRSCKKT